MTSEEPHGDPEGGEERELTPEERERLRQALANLRRSLSPTFFKGSTFKLPESTLRSLSALSAVSSQQSRAFQSLKPIFEAQTVWKKQLTVINSDLLKITGAGQSQLNFLGSQLLKSADFGFNRQVSLFANQFASQQAALFRSMSKVVANLRFSFYPTNLQDIKGLGITDIEQVVILDGIALYEVPRQAIAEKLIRAKDSAARRDILGRKWKEIAADCRASLAECESAEAAPLIRKALNAIDALEQGNAAAAQALAASLIDTLLRKYLPKTKPLLVPSSKTKTPNAYLKFTVRKYIALAPIWQAYQQYRQENGDPIPRTFNRHATSHTVSSLQYSRRNAVQGLMLVCGLLRFVDEEASAQRAA